MKKQKPVVVNEVEVVHTEQLLDAVIEATEAQKKPAIPEGYKLLPPAKRKVRVNTRWIMAPHLAVVYDNEIDKHVDNKPFIVVMEDGTKLYLADVIILERD